MRLFGFKKDGCSRTRGLISAYVDGGLGDADRGVVEQHLAVCPGCLSDVESLRATVKLLRGLPEVAPSRRFAVAPVTPRRSARALPALRYATAAVVVLLVAALAVDQSDVLVRQTGPVRFTADSSEWGPSVDAYWAVNGVRNSIGSEEETQVVLLVPDGTENASAAVESISSNGMVYGSVAGSSADVGQVVLKDADEEAVASGEVEEFAVVSVPSGSSMSLATNSSGAQYSSVGSVIERQDGSYLNMVSSDYTELYSFDMSDSEKMSTAAPTASNDGWLRPVEYALIGLAAILGAATAGLWLWRRYGLAEARVDRGRR